LQKRGKILGGRRKNVKLTLTSKKNLRAMWGGKNTNGKKTSLWEEKI